MAAAAICAAVMFTVSVFMVVVAAGYVGIESQTTLQQGLDGIIGTACDAAVQFDAGCSQGLLGTAADTAGNDDIGLMCLKEAG